MSITHESPCINQILGVITGFLAFMMGVTQMVVFWVDSDLFQEHATSISGWLG